MEFDLEAARAAAAVLESKLRPIARRKVDFNDPKWVEKVRSGPHPLDEAGVRVEAEKLLGEVLTAYAAGDSKLRASIRELLAQASSFAWATAPREPPTTEHGFRQHLLRLSAIEKTEDVRDLIDSVQRLCERARDAGVNTHAALLEVAWLSSDENRARRVFLNAR
jgi:hypothetical protein